MAVGLSAAAWLRQPSVVWAALAFLLAGVGLALAIRMRVALPLAAVAAATLAALALLTASIRARTVERDWPEITRGLLQRGGDRLAADLAEAVSLAVLLADRGSAVLSEDRVAAFRTLARLEPDARFEFSVVGFDRAGSPWAWSGKTRIAPRPAWPGEPDFVARITPFYVVLEASRQTPDGWAVGQVLLQADSAVPDRDGAVAEQFRRRTGVTVEFLRPGSEAGQGALFDYCRPSCSSVVEGDVPDTLLSVRLMPPSQGGALLRLERVGGAWSVVFTLLAFALLLVAGSGVARWTGIIGGAAMLLLTPAGGLIGLGALFSPANFYLGFLGPLTASAGAVLLTAVLTVTVFALAPRRRPGTYVAVGWIGTAGAVAVPFALWRLTDGITPQVSGAGVGLWLSWQLPLALSGVALGLVIMLTRPPGRLGRWRVAAGALTTVAAAALGYAMWEPAAVWPWWYALVWSVPLILGSQAASPMRGLLEITVVTGVAASLLTWNADVRGRLLLAQRDTDRLVDGDPVAIGLLDRFGDEIREGPFPETEAELYARWRRSPLSRADYPAALAAWSPAGDAVAAVELALLEVPLGPVRLAAGAAREADRSVLVRQDAEDGIRYLLAAPFADGSVVSVLVGPRTRLIAPVLEARFLRGERRLEDPYEMSLGEPVPEEADAANRVEWMRDGTQVHGSRVIDLAGGARHLHISVPLRGPTPLVIRGILIVLLNVAAVALIVMVAAGARKGFGIPDGLRDFARLRSYRTRLAIALATFFVLPTLGFAVWSVGRIRANADRSRDLLIQQTLRDAAGTARRFGGFATLVPRDLEMLSQELGADLFRYRDGMLEGTSTPVLEQLGLIPLYLDPDVFLRLLGDDVLELSADAVIGGQGTRVGYRALGDAGLESPVLAAPRLVDASAIVREQEDLVLGVLLSALLGLAAAAALAAIASQSLARPVQALRTAAQAVGRGDRLPPNLEHVPAEFVPVVDAFERMVADIERTQTALENARQRMATVLANVATGVVALDGEARVTIANPRAAELVGRAIPAGERISDVGFTGWSRVWEWTAGMMDHGTELASEEFTVGRRRIRAQVAALHSGDGGCVLALDDITDLARAVRVLAWGELAQQIAHEIKNPLTPIRLGIQHLQRARRDGRADFDYTLERTGQQILAEIERLDAIARAFARFGAPPAEAAALAATDLAKIARETADLYRFEEGAGVRMEGDSEVEGLARRDEVKEVLINLIENARDAGATDITLLVRHTGACARITVTDNGRGITADHMARVFEPQFSTTSSGTGLGLAICKRLVEGWGGTIAVESRVGEGTRVVIETARGSGSGGSSG